MKHIVCKECGSTDLSVDFELNPNDLNAARNLFLDSLRENGLDDQDVWCEQCQSYVEIAEAEPLRLSGEDNESYLFDLWRQGRQDMFVVVHRTQQRTDGECLVYHLLIFYAACRAEDWIGQRIALCDVNPDYEHVFEVFYFNPIIDRRPEVYNTPDDVIRLLSENRLELLSRPIYTRKP